MAITGGKHCLGAYICLVANLTPNLYLSSRPVVSR